MQRFYRRFRSGVLNLAAGIGLICIVLFALSMLFQVRVLNVLSGSMEPEIPTGSLLLTTPIEAADIEIGDVITVNRPNDRGLITHRVIEISPVPDAPGAVELRMQGDANQTEDPQPYLVREAGRYLMHVPGLGVLASLVKTRLGISIGIALAALLFALFLFPGKAVRGAPPTAEPR
ncbi:signal peptidase I [Leucobacter sp. M11]|uniref:signal peptidase I n=1 Tax=Leucobacter sp. M11 TaxID=2993565 RepID=UPI002D7F5002|nr:signal peptidase I [Leucobacter sp. M11]MEB4616644.1 signal peptidase I [Leucobacter sp. M11]